MGLVVGLAVGLNVTSSVTDQLPDTSKALEMEMKMNVENLSDFSEPHAQVLDKYCDKPCAFDPSVSDEKAVILCGHLQPTDDLDDLLMRYCRKSWSESSCNEQNQRKKYSLCKIPNSNLTIAQYYIFGCNGQGKIKLNSHMQICKQ